MDFELRELRSSLHRPLRPPLRRDTNGKKTHCRVCHTDAPLPLFLIPYYTRRFLVPRIAGTPSNRSIRRRISFTELRRSCSSEFRLPPPLAPFFAPPPAPPRFRSATRAPALIPLPVRDPRKIINKYLECDGWSTPFCAEAGGRDYEDESSGICMRAKSLEGERKDGKGAERRGRNGEVGRKVGNRGEGPTSGDR